MVCGTAVPTAGMIFAKLALTLSADSQRINLFDIGTTMQKIRLKFPKTIHWADRDHMVSVEMSYDIATGWKSAPHFGHTGRHGMSANLDFRILRSDGLDLTTILAMEDLALFKSIQLECLHKMEALEGVPEDLARDLRREASTPAGFARA